MAKQTNIVFFGTPEFSCPSFKALLLDDEINVCALITQPDKAVGRKQIITPPATKALLKELGMADKVKVLQPERLNKCEETLTYLEELKPDFAITVAYGQILKQRILDICPFLNVHASLLPKYRGPAPINWSIINGDEVVGITTMNTELGVDTGDMLLKYETQLKENENALELTERLSCAAPELLLKTIKEYSNIKAEKQTVPEEMAYRFGPFMDKKLGEVDFSAKELVYRSANPKQTDFVVHKLCSAQNIHNLVRGTYPWPGAFFMQGENKIIILETKVEDTNSQEEAGKILASSSQEGSITVASQQGKLKILKLKPQGKKEMSAYAWLQGCRAEKL